VAEESLNCAVQDSAELHTALRDHTPNAADLLL
ncbi:uncharacterized, partial [Tachysurus ichikawai]